MATIPGIVCEELQPAAIPVTFAISHQHQPHYVQSQTLSRREKITDPVVICVNKIAVWYDVTRAILRPKHREYQCTFTL